MKKILDFIKESKIIAVIRHEEYSEAKKMCEGCIEGGIKIIEITMTVNNANELISEMSKKFPEVTFGAGTILKLEEAKKSVEAGAKFLISPMTNFEVIDWAISKDVLYIPGVMTINEIEAARNRGSLIQKIFPGDILKPNFVKSVLAPIPSVKLIPSGGVDLDNAKTWLHNGVVAISVGSNLVGKMFGKIDKMEVKKNAIKFMEAIK